MKAFMLLVLFVVSMPVFANRAEMKKLIQITDGSIWRVPEGYRKVQIESIEVKGGLKAYITRTTKYKMKVWSEYVLTGGEFDNKTLAQRKVIAANPLAQLEVAALLEVAEVYKIYKGRNLIGYFIEITDHVQATIYQDGAWYDSYFDSELNLVQSFDQSA